MAVLRRAGVVLVLGLALSGCSSLNPFASKGPQMAALADFTPEAKLDRAWHVSVGEDGRFRFEPALANDSVYVAGHDGVVLRMDGADAAWRVKLGKKLSSGVGTDGRLVVVVAEDGEAIGLNASDGSVRWKAAVNAEVLAPAAIGAGMVVLRASDHRLIALDSQNGERRWVYQRPTPPLALRNFAGVVVEGGVVVAGFPGGKVAAVNLANGAALWELTVAQPRGATELERMTDVAGDPVIGGRQLCAIAYQGRVGCFDGSNGASLWSREMSSTVGMSRDGDVLYVTDDKDAVFAMDTATGATQWSNEGFARRALTRPLPVGKLLVVGDGAGYVHVLTRAEGKLVGRVRADSSGIAVAPQAWNDGFVVQTRSGDVYAYHLH